MKNHEKSSIFKRHIFWSEVHKFVDFAHHRCIKSSFLCTGGAQKCNARKKSPKKISLFRIFTFLASL